MDREISLLIKDAIRTDHERRAESRHPFVYPVSLHLPNSEADFGFSRDISLKGIGLILSKEWAAGSIADLELHNSTTPLCVKSEARWSRQYGDGWFLVGWRFLSMVTLPAIAQTTDRRS